MNKYLMDTEFIRATKERVHFIEVALFDVESSQIIDFHMNARLNNWEHRYFTRALNGHYGKRTQAVFEAVDVLHSGKFNRRLVTNFCAKSGVEYKYNKLNDVHQLVPDLSDSILYAWDISNDKDLFKIINVNNCQLVDVQVMWREKFGGKQLSLIDAYKHVLYNKQINDEHDLISYAHYACCDVMLLNQVVNFIESWSEQVNSIPIERSVRDTKIMEIETNISRWKKNVLDLNHELEITTDNDLLMKLSRKQINDKKKISKALKAIESLQKHKVYEQPWWCKKRA